MCRHPRFTFLLVGGFVLGIGLLLPRAQQARPLPRIVFPNRFEYHDDHDGRRLADIRLKIVEREGRRSLAMVISAVGAQVEPIPGFAGVRGANRHTAEQIENILSGRFSFLVTTEAEDGSAPWLGQWRAGRHGSIPQRRLLPSGRIDVLAVTPREYPLELLIDTKGLVEGRQTTQLWFDGVPRLRVVYQLARNEVRILEFKSLGSEPSGKEPPIKEDRDPKPPPKDEPETPPVTDADWNARDLEGKWVLYQKIAQADEKLGKTFIPYLVQRKEYDFLERIALHQPLYEGGIAAAWALAKADAPQWLRVAAWQRQMEIDHGETDTSKMIHKHNPARALAWLEKYAIQATASKEEKKTRRRKHDQVLLSDLERLRKAKLKPGELGNALPPIEPAEVFRYLDAPKDLADFGDRQRVESGKVYVHQVLRAIQSFVQSGRFREPWIGKVLQLTRHPHTKVRQAAFLAFTHFGAQLASKESPVDEIRKVLDDPKEPVAIREAALMAFSALDHPQVYIRLHELALETGHPAWRAAVSRLYDIGNEYTLDHLNRLDKTRLTEPDADLLERIRGQLRQWAEDPQRGRSISLSVVETHLERAAWATSAKSSLEKSLTTWTKSWYVKQPDDKFVTHLETVRDKYVPKHTVPDSAAFTRLVRSLATEILATPRQPEKKPLPQK
jgi:hypothetical protein